MILLGQAPSAWSQAPGVLYPEPPPSSYRALQGVRFAAGDSEPLLVDIYRPAEAKRAAPVLVFHTMGTQRANAAYTAWARLVASKGLVGVIADLRPAKAAEDFRTLLAHLEAHALEYGVDTAAITAFGASSNGYNLFRTAEERPDPRLKAIIVYYSGSEVPRFRLDLPVLYVRAGLDRPPVNAGLDSLVARALAQNAPITVVNFPAGHHGFELTDDDAITRDLIEQTIQFVTRVTAPAYRAALNAGIGYAEAAAHVAMGDFTAAARAYADLVARNPDDPRLRLSYGEALLGDRQFATACREFESLKGKGLGPRDLGLPAARACLSMGDPARALTWLKTIPRRFLPARVKDDTAFAALANRAEFKALFEPAESRP
jgi:dienelactone hydrolase